MYLSSNIQFLRKKSGITQEELAEHLNVSRQSVSKWETGEAYPETDKLIALCDKFAVTMDALVREDLTEKEHGSAAAHEKDTVCVNMNTCAPEGNPHATCSTAEYSEHMDSFAKKISLGVAIILFGVALCIAIAGWGTYAGSEVLEIISGCAVILAVSVATYMFISAGIGHEAFMKENASVCEEFTKQEQSAFNKKFAAVMASLVSSILVDVVALVAATAIAGAASLSESANDLTMCIIVAVFMAVLSFLVGGICYIGIQKSKYDYTEINKRKRREKGGVADAICGVIMMTATAIFLFSGFVYSVWHPAWIVFPIGGILCSIVNIIFGIKE